MATKDWTTLKENEYGWSGTRKDGTGSFDVHDTDNLGWTFQASWHPYRNNDWTRKRFKTKSQAIRFARQWMRSN